MKQANKLAAFITKLANAFKVHGVAGVLWRGARLPFHYLKQKNIRAKIFSQADAQSVFTEIYKTNWWGSSESVSGTGSTLAYTHNLRNQLPKLFSTFQIGSVFDAPCGDFNWMKHVVSKTDIQYIGGDIVSELIQNNQLLNQSSTITFINLNIIEDEFPKADLWICRDCLIHFSFMDTLQVLENYLRSKIPYFLTTTHHNKSNFKNLDIQTGDVRIIDLFSEPFNFPKPPLLEIDDWLEPDLPRVMALFDRSQVLSAVSKMRQILSFDSPMEV
jgi:hypothetical protein